jgi:acetolactate synthase I/II/III large subunit
MDFDRTVPIKPLTPDEARAKPAEGAKPTEETKPADASAQPAAEEAKPATAVPTELSLVEQTVPVTPLPDVAGSIPTPKRPDVTGTMPTPKRPDVTGTLPTPKRAEVALDKTIPVRPMPELAAAMPRAKTPETAPQKPQAAVSKPEAATVKSETVKPEIVTVKPETVTFKPETTADAWLGLLATRGVKYLFANGGTDFAPVVEAYAKGQKLGWKLPQVVIVPHENLGVAMAHGYTMVTGRPQAMMVHVGVGTANAMNGLINASRQNVPILFTAGRSPLTEGHGAPSGAGALLGARDNYIHWAQEHFDQGAMLREFVKWDYELRHAEQTETVLDRALAIAKSEPQGPVYVTLPREILASDFSKTGFSATRTIATASPPAPDLNALEAAGKLLGAAQHPLLITANGGRTAESARAIEQLAQTLAVPVVQYRPRHLALSTEHPMHGGWDPHALLKEADVILVVDCDVPWIPKQGKPKADAKVIHVGPDPLFTRYPLRGFRADISLTGSVAPTVQALWRSAQKQIVSPTKVEERRKVVSDYSTQLRSKSRAGVEPMPAVITGKWLSACINRVMGKDSILVNEYPTVLEEMEIREPGRYFANSPAGGLGWGMGAALGAKLAAPDKTVICALGDGAYMFGNPSAGHYVSEAMQLPVLFVIANNARWAAVHRSTLATYPKGYAAEAKKPPFATLEPSPRFEHVVMASGGHGESVTEPKALLPALERALKVVREEKRQALLNVCLEASYVKTS